MDWEGEGTVCAVRRHGEGGAVVRLLTLDQGLIAGFVPGGMGKRQRATLEPGNRVKARWRARLAEHLGTMQVESITPRAAQLLSAPTRLSAMMSLLAVLTDALPERQAVPEVAAGLEAVLDIVMDAELPLEVVATAIVRFEVGILSAAGFGLDLRQCAATGALDDLVYVSPKSGRAVSRDAGQLYKDRLLALPQFLLGSQAGGASHTSLTDGFKLTGFFLARWIFDPANKDLPPARERFVRAVLARLAADEAKAEK